MDKDLERGFFLKLLKNIATLFLTVLISLNMCGTACADDSLDVSLSYNDYPTYDVPADLNVLADGYYIEEYAQNEKGLLLLAKSRRAEYKVNASLKETFVISFELVTCGKGLDGFISLSDGTRNFTPIKFVKTDLSLRLFDNNKIGFYRQSGKTRIDVSVDTSSKSYDVYINGTKTVSSYYSNRMSLDSLSYVTFCFEPYDDAENGIILDNINCHSGILPKSNYPVAQFNMQKNEKPTFEEKQIGNIVITNEGFEEESLSVMTEDYGHAFKLIHDENDNGCLSVNKIAESRALFASSVNTGEMDRLVIEYKVKIFDENSSFDLCQFKSEKGNWSSNVQVRGSVVKGNKGEKSYKLPLYVWTKLSFAFSVSGKFFDFYVDDKLIEKGIEWANPFPEAISEIRFSLGATKGYVTPANLFVDDYRVYEGKIPRTISADQKIEFPPYTILPSDNAEDALMKDRVGLHLKSGVMYSKGQRSELDVPPYIKNDRTMIPVRAVSEAFDLDVKYDDINKSVSVNDNTVLIIGKNEMTVDGKTITLDCAPEIKDGRTFLPLRDLCEKALGKNVYFDNSVVNGGMIIIGNTEFTPPGDPESLQRLNDYLFFLRPSSEWLTEKLEEKNYKNIHPRILINNNDVTRLKTEIKENSIKSEWFKELLEACETFKTVPIPEYGTYDGTRMSREPVAEALDMALVYLITGDISWVDAAWPKIEAVCSWKDWNPDREFLNCADFSFLVATCYDWMYDALSDEQKKIMEEALYDKCLIEAKKWWYGIKGPKDKWQMAKANWNPVCNSGISIAALSMLDVYPEEAGEIISLCTRGLEYVSQRFAPDGSWFEGPAYWEFVFKFLARYLDAFEKVFGTTFAIDKMEGLDKAATSILYLQSSYGSFNFSDADVEVIYPEALYYLSNHYNNPSATAVTLSKNKRKTTSIYNTPFALIWYNTDIDDSNDSITLPYDATFSGDGAFAVMRDSWIDDYGTYVGIKAGRAVYNHSHLDLGSFIFETEGERWAIDLGKDNYNLPDYWDSNEKRWKFYRLRAEGHNTIVINPDSTGADMNLKAVAEIESQKSSEKGAITVVNMTDALKKDVLSARRGFFLTDDRKSLVVRDEVTLLAPTDEFYWTMHTKATEALIDGNRVIISSAGKKMLLEFACNADFDISFEDAVARPGMPTVANENQNAGVKKIVLKVHGKKTVNLTAKLSPLDVMTTPISDYDISIDDWNLPEGSIQEEKYVPDEIYYGNRKLEGFNEVNRNMVVNYVEGISEIQKISAKSHNYKIEITEPENFEDYGIIKVYGEDENYTQYVVSFRKIPAPTKFEGFESVAIRDVSASDVPQPLNNEYNVLDGNLETRWSAANDLNNYVWLQFELDKESELDTLMLATYLGDQRQTKFKVEVSENGTDFKEVFNGQTGGQTLDFEEFTFEKCIAKYVRIKFFGTTEGSWNSPTDVVFANKK